MPLTPHLSRGEIVVAALYAGLVAVMWPSPLLGLLHAESSAIAAGVVFFATGLLAVGAFRRGGKPPAVVGRSLALALIPAVLLTASLAWRANCGYAQGAALYLLFVPPSAVLAAALAWAITGVPLRWPGAALVACGAAISIVPVLLGPGLHPQLYTYNPVWGGVLGPIYDEELALRPGLLAHRALVLLWVAWLFALGTWLRTRRLARTGAVLAAGIGVAYLLAPALGVVTTPGTIESRLAARAEHGPFVLHYDAGTLPAHDARVIGETLRYRHARYARILGGAPRQAVHVYLYPDGDTRAALTGARSTSVTPVWLRRPQIHLLQQQATPDNLAHELVHVFAREFGSPVLRASPAVGLVEGLAVALEPPAGYPAPAEQVAAARSLSPAAAGRLSEGPAAAVTASMSPLGFWTGRGAVSYITTGAFVAWLLDRHGASPLRRAYRTGRFTAAYGRPVEALAEEWAQAVGRAPVTPEALALAEWRFSQPSLLEMRCPHHVPRERLLTRRAGRAAAAGDASEALVLYRRALDHAPSYIPALVGWASVSLSTGARPATIAQRLAAASADTLEPSLLLAEGDARVLSGDRDRGLRAYAAASGALPPFAREAREEVALRRALPPEAVRWLHDLDPARAARALEELSAAEPAAAWFAAARWVESGEPARALAVLSRAPAPARPSAAAMRLAALASLARLSGRPVDAARFAADAARAWRAAGAPALAREQDDRADEARWVALLSRPPRQGQEGSTRAAIPPSATAASR